MKRKPSSRLNDACGRAEDYFTAERRRQTVSAQPRLRASVCSWLIWEWENLPRAKHPRPPPLCYNRGGHFLNQSSGVRIRNITFTFSDLKSHTYTLYTVCLDCCIDTRCSILSAPESVGVHFCGAFSTMHSVITRWSNSAGKVLVSFSPGVQ